MNSYVTMLSETDKTCNMLLLNENYNDKYFLINEVWSTSVNETNKVFAGSNKSIMEFKYRVF